VYPVVVGTGAPVRDVAVQQVHLSQTAFEDAPVSVQADVTAAGCAGELLVAQLLDDTGKMVADQTQHAPSGGNTVVFRFQVRPSRGGLNYYGCAWRPPTKRRVRWVSHRGKRR